MPVLELATASPRSTPNRFRLIAVSPTTLEGTLLLRLMADHHLEDNHMPETLSLSIGLTKLAGKRVLVTGVGGFMGSHLIEG